jgi:hypothetical protein
MYTQTTIDKPSLEPNYTDWNGTQGVAGTESYGGLVRTAGKGTANGGAYRGYIPVMFSYNTTKNSSITSNGTEVIEKNGTGANAPVLRADRYLSDKSNGEYDEDYTIIASLNGPTFGVDATTGAWSGACTDNTAYMYFFGGFKDVIGGDTYSTTVYVEQSWD